jgi:hypothetical protein
MMSDYIFILCPPFSGSTVLWKLIASSDNVSSLPQEGQFLPEIEDVARRDPWNGEITLPWISFKQVWEKYWQDLPYKIEKSPPHLIRANEIEKIFIPTFFVAMIRNPYAFCEGYSRRSSASMEDSASFWQRCARYQKSNIEQLSRILFFTYEAFTQETNMIIQQLQDFLPGLGSMDWKGNFESQSIFGPISKKIANLNDVKIGRLSSEEISDINHVLSMDELLLQYYGYELIEPGFKHDVWRTRAYAKLKIISNWERAKRLYQRQFGKNRI